MAQIKATAARRPIEHGTRRGYQAHRRRGDEPCGPCKKADCEYQREYGQETRQAKREYMRQYGQRNADRKRERDREWRQRNHAHEIARGRDYRAQNPQIIKRQEDRRQSRRNATKEAASRRWDRWTPTEDQVLLESECTDIELAFMLGRSREAVVKRRARLRKREVAA